MKTASVHLDHRFGTVYVSHFDGKNQLFSFTGYYIEGHVPWVPEDNEWGWVSIESINSAEELARRLFCDLGFNAAQVVLLMTRLPNIAREN